MNLAFAIEIIDSNTIKDEITLEWAYEKFGIDKSNGINETAINDFLIQRIRGLFKNGQWTAAIACRDTIKCLIYKHIIFNQKLQPYFRTLSALSTCLNFQNASEGDIEANWPEAFEAAYIYSALQRYKNDNIDTIYNRELSVANAARILNQQGYEITINGKNLYIEESSEQKIINQIERLVSKMGGLNVAKRIFQNISEKFDNKLKRHHLVPSVSLINKIEPQYPWGYLLQLAIKHINGNRPYDDTDHNWYRLISLAKNYTTVLDIQPYTGLVLHRRTAEGIIQYMREIALYDSLFRFNQLRPSDAGRICRGILKHIDNQKIINGEFTINNIISVVESIFDLVKNQRGPSIITEKQIIKAVPTANKESIRNILQKVLSHAPNQVNKNYSKPTDECFGYEKNNGLDFYSKPLIRMQDKRYLLIDPSICAYATIDSILNALKPHFNNFDSDVGDQAEIFLREELKKFGITPLHGNYTSLISEGKGKTTKAKGECDAVIECSDRIIFMEVKKKALTNKSKSGIDVYILIDLALSLLHAQAQASRHESLLYEKEVLEISNSSNEIHELRKVKNSINREVEKIAVSLLDFGSFQDRAFLSNLLEVSLDNNFSTREIDFSEKFQSLEKYLNTIRNQYNKMKKYQDDYEIPFFNCWFLSIPQVLILLDSTRDEDSFWKALSKIRHISTGTSDFYYEYSQFGLSI